MATESMVTQGNKRERLFLVLGAFFLTNALLAEFVGAKIFSVEITLGFEPLNLTLFGQGGLSLNMTAGVLPWPIVFIMTDIINEYFGQRGVRRLSYLAVVMIVYAFAIVGLTILVSPADFWAIDPQTGMDMDLAYQKVFGQGLWIIIGSLVAFLIGQLLDAFTFQRIRRLTGERLIWLRATGSTVVSQLIDSFVVIFIAFYIGGGWELGLVLAVATVNYIYKVGVAVLLTPLIYLAHRLIDQYLGDELSLAMRERASGQVVLEQAADPHQP
ncbi:MAG: queuosine precursor transporter [Bacteroidota bacterium]